MISIADYIMYFSIIITYSIRIYTTNIDGLFR